MTDRQFGQGDTFVVSREEFRRALLAGEVGFEHECIAHYDRYDWIGRLWRHFPAIGGIRWDCGDPGDEHDGD